MRKRKEKTERKERKDFLEWCERQSFRKGLKAGWLDVIFSFCFVLLAYFLAMYCIGNGAYNYSDSAYEQLQIAIGTSITVDFGLDTIALSEKVNEYDMSYKNGESTIVCRETVGHFVAEVTVELSEEKLKEMEEKNIPEEYLLEDLSEESPKTYYAIPSTRNYNSREEYLIAFYLEVALWMLVGLLIYLGIKLLWNTMLFVIAKGYIKFSQIHNQKSQKGLALSEL